MSYTPHTEADRAAMLSVIGAASVEELFAPLPPDARLREPLALPDPLDEIALVRHLNDLASRNASNQSLVSFLGAGLYDHFSPAVVDALVSRGEFATSYTPYQPELSQGMLQAIYEFQSMICALTDMDMANASMYDAATAAAEAALMLVDATGRDRVVVSRGVHPHYRQVLSTYCNAADVAVAECPYNDGTTDQEALAATMDDRTACVILQQPNFFGCIEDLRDLLGHCRTVGARSVVIADPVSLGLLKPPGAFGADVVVGEGQGLGCPVGFGGPLLGFFAFKSEYQRRFPGRIVGMTHDGEGRRGFTMTLRTREQDIRREKATSNICTNEALLALAATVHLCALGPQGLRRIADLSAQKAHYTAAALTAIPGVKLAFGSRFFKEFAIILDSRTPVHDLCRRLRDDGFIAGFPLGMTYPELDNALLVAVTEKRSREQVDAFAAAFRRQVVRGGM